MESSGYADLYALQDQALATVFEEPLGFYLTGGTALSRFHLNHRYNDDLDLFTHDIGPFPDAFRLLYGKIRKRWSDVRIEVDGRDFKRLRIHDGAAELKLDFVADRIARIGLPLQIGSAYVDTVRNILSNKVCAIMGRDEARDVADLLYIARKRLFSWSAIVAEASGKESLQLEDLLYRLTTFPVETLRSVPFFTEDSLALHSGTLDRIRADLAQLGPNTVAPPEAIAL